MQAEKTNSRNLCSALRLLSSAFRFPSVCLPFVFAAVSFAYALATSDGLGQAVARAGVQSRAVGTPLRFTTPFLLAGTDPAFPTGGNTTDDPQGFDLGDVCGTGPFTRIITATGGYQPYTFTTQALFDKFNLGNDVAPPTLVPSISPIGKLSGALSVPFGSALRFNILLTDFIATQRIGIFRFNLINCPGTFKFAIDRLPLAQLGNHYYADLETNNGVAPITYRVLPGVNAAGKAFARLEDAGLTLSPDGILIGRPVVAGTLNFSVQATDATGAVALARAGSGSSQAFALTVEANTQANSELATVQLSVSGRTAGGSQDTLTFSGYLDTRGEKLATLAGTALTIRVGPAAFAGTFDARGKIATTLAGKGKLTVALQPNTGLLKIKISNVDLANPLGASAFKTKTNQTFIFGLELVSFRTSDVVAVTTTVSSGKYALRYGLGKRGLPVTGGFQILTVFGQDGHTGGRAPIFSLETQPLAKQPKQPKTPAPKGPDGSAWKVLFVAIPRVVVDGGKSGGDVLVNGGNATIRIGQNFSQNVSLTKKSVKLEFKNDGKSPGIFRLRLNPKSFLCTLETNVLAESDTAIQPAINTKDLTVFPLGMDLTGYSGQTGRIIAPNTSFWRGR
jgi:hypothetical protein